MLNEFTTKDMSDLLYADLSQIKDDGNNITEVFLEIPTDKNLNLFRLINTPLDSVLKSENGVPISKEFQILIQHFGESKSQCMQMASNTDKVLQKRNILRTSAENILYDEQIQKYKFITSYEVRWEAPTNSFSFILKK